MSCLSFIMWTVGIPYVLSKKVPKLSKNTRKPSKLMTAVKANANANWSPFGTAKQKYQRYTKKIINSYYITFDFKGIVK